MTWLAWIWLAGGILSLAALIVLLSHHGPRPPDDYDGFPL